MARRGDRIRTHFQADKAVSSDRVESPGADEAYLGSTNRERIATSVSEDGCFSRASGSAFSSAGLGQWTDRQVSQNGAKDSETAEDRRVSRPRERAVFSPGALEASRDIRGHTHRRRSAGTAA
jgi:hypothetical protein